ncbi:MAG TPA: gluconate 2-dehydrogenase subunit 3 family protein [Steroidobacteraceae bacterium]|jgi:gluconate 2-dehydrogenase gamma chain|nr:gluconate 2-dehydrogenase subunit 3 family protein [Steroidobacteraceae bacterium]
MKPVNRREVLIGSAALLLADKWSSAEVIHGKLPFDPSSASVQRPVDPAGWKYFSAEEAATVQAIVDRIIPPDPQTPGGKEAGCAVFIDRQLAGGYGHAEGLYVQGPFREGTQQQGPQSDKDPAQQYRAALASIERHARDGGGGGRTFAQLAPDEQDALLRGIEDGSLPLEGLDGKKFFEDMVTDVQQGFFADPIYGGNRDMCAWKMIGYPGARYDYREWVGRHNEPYPYPPVSMQGRADWNPKPKPT